MEDLAPIPEARGLCPNGAATVGNRCLGQSCNSWQEEKRTWWKTWMFPMETDGWTDLGGV
ncbi:hypothetical protein E2320_006328 [Naja naja]|nr:hypothetical protein E2320_006328 [Naja naja]